ncbi:copper chaperone PCu(A)C [Acrocarpospora sp. B8E8]|uniref:copper chaperone PCu(A)C n=1 Tax=Acrocarpospora sp. B8E8 TaxID=3153572 RepID=UPI00325FD705
MTMSVRRMASLCLIAITLSGCGSEPTAAAPAAASPAAVITPAPAPTLSIVDPWVKTTKEGMTAAFGTLVNDTDADVVVVSGASPLSPKIELHEVVDNDGKMIMRPKEGGFTIPARSSHQLQPGGDHIMLMGVTEEVKPGAQIEFTLTLKDGGTVTFTAVGKDFAGGKEDYQPGMDMGES